MKVKVKSLLSKTDTFIMVQRSNSFVQKLAWPTKTGEFLLALSP